MRKIDNELTFKKYMKLRFLWPYGKWSLPLSLTFFKVSGTVRIIQASVVMTLIRYIRNGLKGSI